MCADKQACAFAIFLHYLLSQFAKAFKCNFIPLSLSVIIRLKICCWMRTPMLSWQVCVCMHACVYICICVCVCVVYLCVPICTLHVMSVFCLSLWQTLVSATSSRPRKCSRLGVGAHLTLLQSCLKGESTMGLRPISGLVAWDESREN